MYERRVTLKNAFRELIYFRNRILVAILFVVVLLLVLIYWLMELQVKQYDSYRTRSDKNRIRALPVAPTRGLIFDRNGVILAENRSIYSLELIPEEVDDLEKTLSDLKNILQLTESDIETFRKENKRKRGRFRKVPVKQKLTEKEVALFSVERHKFPGVSIEARLVRYYPFGEALVHALGYVGRINDREQAAMEDPQNYKATRHIGKVGLEKFYEKELHGVIGSQVVEVDVHEKAIRVLSEKPPRQGLDLHLSLDVNLQLKAIQALGEQRGAVVAIDPNSGDVLALVSQPGYNPNDFVTGISSKKYKKLLDSKDRPLFNRALRGQYSPGSTIKPHLAWLGLHKKLITPQFSIHDLGFYVIPNEKLQPGQKQRRYRDWKKGGHGPNVTYKKAIVQSCDTYFYDLAYRLGIDKIHEGMSRFGFGDLTDIDIGEEVPAILPSRSWKRGYNGKRWFPGETVIVGIGQGYWTTTPVQLVNATAAIARNGDRYKLRLVNQVSRQKLEKLIYEPQQVSFKEDFGNPKLFKLIQSAMKAVNHTLTGTAFSAFKETTYVSAGKTGTVQLVGYAQDEEYDENEVDSHLRDNALYIGYAPYDNPQIAIAVVVENAGGGGTNAAPIARAVMDVFLNTDVQSKKSGQ